MKRAPASGKPGTQCARGCGPQSWCPGSARRLGHRGHRHPSMALTGLISCSRATASTASPDERMVRQDKQLPGAWRASASSVHISRPWRGFDDSAAGDPGVEGVPLQSSRTQSTASNDVLESPSATLSGTAHRRRAGWSRKESPYPRTGPATTSSAPTRGPVATGRTPATLAISSRRGSMYRASVAASMPASVRASSRGGRSLASVHDPAHHVGLAFGGEARTEEGGLDVLALQDLQQTGTATWARGTGGHEGDIARAGGVVRDGV